MKLQAWFAGEGLGAIDLACLQQDWRNGLEVVVTGQCDEQMEQETFAVLKHLWTIVIHSWRQ